MKWRGKQKQKSKTLTLIFVFIMQFSQLLVIGVCETALWRDVHNDQYFSAILVQRHFFAIGVLHYEIVHRLWIFWVFSTHVELKRIAKVEKQTKQVRLLVNVIQSQTDNSEK